MCQKRKNLKLCRKWSKRERKDSEKKRHPPWAYRPQMSGGNCAEGSFCRQIFFFYSLSHTQTNSSEEIPIIPLVALLKACNLW